MHQHLGAPLIASGSPYLFAVNSDGFVNGGIFTVDYEYSDLALNNGSDLLTLECAGSEIDAVLYDMTSPSSAGVSMELDPAFTDAVSNDFSTNWCEAGVVEIYGVGDRGTPSGLNAPCP